LRTNTSTDRSPRTIVYPQTRSCCSLAASTRSQVAPSRSPVDNGLVIVLDRRFAALRWQRELIVYAAGPDQLAALRLHAAIVNPAITGLTQPRPTETTAMIPSAIADFSSSASSVARRWLAIVARAFAPT
jgi:hypothetical protein